MREEYDTIQVCRSLHVFKVCKYVRMMYLPDSVPACMQPGWTTNPRAIQWTRGHWLGTGETWLPLQEVGNIPKNIRIGQTQTVAIRLSMPGFNRFRLPCETMCTGDENTGTIQFTEGASLMPIGSTRRSFKTRRDRLCRIHQQLVLAWRSPVGGWHW